MDATESERISVKCFQLLHALQRGGSNGLLVRELPQRLQNIDLLIVATVQPHPNPLWTEREQRYKPQSRRVLYLAEFGRATGDSG